jgi:hypothetical protein
MLATVEMRVALAVALLLVACKGDAVQCEKGCRNYGALVYWKNAEVDIASKPPAQREAQRKMHLAKFQADLENGIDVCVSQCQSANNQTDMDCMVRAKTGDQAIACYKN